MLGSPVLKRSPALCADENEPGSAFSAIGVLRLELSVFLVLAAIQVRAGLNPLVLHRLRLLLPLSRWAQGSRSLSRLTGCAFP